MRPRRELSLKQRALLVFVSSAVALLAGFGVLQARKWSNDSNVFHLYVLGGSSAWGEPYAPHVPHVLGRLVSMQFGNEIAGRRVKVVTLAQAGADIARVEASMKDVVAIPAEPGTAMALIYSGHNEFIWSDKHRDLRDNPRRLIDVPVVDAERSRQMLDEYVKTMGSIVSKFQKANIPVIVSTVAANVRDWDPNRSCIQNPANATAVTKLWQESEAAAKAERWNEARASLTKLLKLEPNFAHAHFLLGRTFLETGDSASAKAHLQLATDNDANPTRSVSSQNMALREFCTTHNVPLADSLKAMEAASPGGIVGTNLIWDNVHPRMEGFILMAQAFGEQVERITGAKRIKWPMDVASIERKFGIDQDMMGLIYAGRGQTCYGHATRTWDQTPRLLMAEGYFDQALDIQPRNADILCSVAVMQLMRGEVETSLKTWHRARDLDSEITERRMGNLLVRQLFARQGVENALARVK